ncbi:unnamed protein product, partial [marine sediment metagenome]
ADAIIVFEVLEDAVDPVIVSTDVDYELGATTATVGSKVTVTVVATDDLSDVETVTIDATEIEDDTPVVTEGLLNTWTIEMIVGEEVEVGTYTLTITATDYAENTDTTTVEVEVATDLTGLYVDLELGWNMFSLPLIPDDSSITAILGDVMENVESVWSYDEGWSTYFPGLPMISTLTDLEDGKGYWVKMTADDTVTVSGVELPTGPGIIPPLYEVDAGWNLIGFKSVDEMEIRDYLTTIPDLVLESSVCYGWDSTSQAYEMVSLGEPIEDEMFVPGEGYWLYLTEAANIAPPKE